MFKYLLFFTLFTFSVAYAEDDFSELFMLETQGFDNIESITSPLLTFNISGKSYDIVVVTVGQRDGRPYFPIFTLNKQSLKKFRDAFAEFEGKSTSSGVITDNKLVDDIVVNKWKLYTGDGEGLDKTDNLTISFNLLTVDDKSSYLVIDMVTDNETVAKIRLDNYDTSNFSKAISEENIKIITDKAKSKKRPKSMRGTSSKSSSKNSKDSKSSTKKQ